MNDETIELLAAYAHRAWADYMDYFLRQCEHEDGSFALPHAYHIALRKLIATPYDELTDIAKNSDRDEARKMLAIVEAQFSRSAT